MSAGRPAGTRLNLSPGRVLYFLLGTGLLVLLLLQVDFGDLLTQILRIPPGLLILGGSIYLLKGVARGIRFWRINTAPRPPFMKMLRLTLATSLASQLLPLKLGELTYVYAVKKDFRTPLSQGVSALMIIRLFDLLAISLLFIAATLGLGLSGSLSVYFVTILAFIGVLLVVLGGLVFAGQRLAAFSARLLEIPILRKVGLLQKLQKAVEDLLAELGKYRGSQYLELIGYPLVEWGLNFAMYYILLQGIGLAPRPIDPVVAVTFAALASVLPINSFGNFGTQEAGWATGLILLGYSRDAALTSGFATHLLSLGYMLILGGLAWLSYLTGAGFAARPVEKSLDQG